MFKKIKRYILTKHAVRLVEQIKKEKVSIPYLYRIGLFQGKIYERGDTLEEENQ